MFLGGAYSESQYKLFYSFVRTQPSTAPDTMGFPTEVHEARIGYVPSSDLGATGSGVGTLVQHPPYYASNALVVDDANGYLYSFDMNISVLNPLPTDPVVVFTTEVSSYLVRHDLDGSNRVVLAEGTFTFGGLYEGGGSPPTLWGQPRVAQLVNGVLYYIDAGHIGRINVDGTGHQVLFQIRNELAPGEEVQLAVSASTGRIFFTALTHWEDYHHDRLYWIPIDGTTGRANLILAPEYVSYVGVVADDANNRLFVAGKLASGQRLAVGTVDYNGANRVTLAEFEDWQADYLMNDWNPAVGSNGGFALFVKTSPPSTEDQEWETLSLVDSILAEITDVQATFNNRMAQLRTKVNKLRGRLNYAYDDIVTTGLSMPSTTTGGGGGPSGPAAVRDPLKRPYASNSIWNMPIGADAAYTPANLHADFVSSANLQHDNDIIILTPDAPIQSVIEATESWGSNVAEGRCIADGSWLFNAPLPTEFSLRWECCTSDSAAILAENSRNIYQTSPFAHCNATSPWTSLNNWEITDTLDGAGIHGRSNTGLSNLGGTIRLGELLNTTGPIEHALKVAVWGAVDFYPGSNAYRWPARWGYWDNDFNGTVPELQPGALLALLPSFDVEASLSTQPGRKIAQALKDYGAYVNANSWSPSIRIFLENGPFGAVSDEFAAHYGFPFDTQWNPTDPWQEDIQTIFASLNVVTNWDESAYTTVAASNGAQGVGGGSPRVPWAAPLDPSFFV